LFHLKVKFKKKHKMISNFEAGDMVHAEEHLPSEHKALNSNARTVPPKTHTSKYISVCV
jgi:hypothetical protein